MNSDVTVKADRVKTGKGMTVYRGTFTIYYVFVSETLHYHVNVSLWVSSAQSPHFVKQRTFLPLCGETMLLPKGREQDRRQLMGTLRVHAGVEGHGKPGGICNLLFPPRQRLFCDLWFP